MSIFFGAKTSFICIIEVHKRQLHGYKNEKAQIVTQNTFVNTHHVRI